MELLDSSELWQDGLVLGLIAVLGVYILRRLRPDFAQEEESHELEYGESSLISEESLETTREFGSAPSEIRRQILDVYESVDQRLVALGYERHAAETIRSRAYRVQSLLGKPGRVLAALAEHARYGAAEPTAKNLQRAKQVAAEVVARLPRN